MRIGTGMDLSNRNPGAMEPAADRDLWRRENKLAILFRPAGPGEGKTALSVIAWDARAFFGAPARPRH